MCSEWAFQLRCFMSNLYFKIQFQFAGTDYKYREKLEFMCSVSLLYPNTVSSLDCRILWIADHLIKTCSLSTEPVVSWGQ